jgi:hypothetical protein
MNETYVAWVGNVNESFLSLAGAKAVIIGSGAMSAARIRLPPRR